MHRFLIFLFVCFLATFDNPSVVVAQDDDEAAFDIAAKVVRAEVKLAIASDRFKGEFPTERETAMQLYSSLTRHLMGGGGSSGGDRWDYHAGSNNSEAYFNIRHGGNQPDMDSVSITEHVSPFRKMEYTAVPKERLVCLIADHVNQKFVFVNQVKDEPISLFSINGAVANCVTAEKVGQLYLGNQELLSDSGTMLEEFGVTTSFSGFYELLLEEVANRISGVELDDEPFLAIVKLMDSSKFKEREAAMKRLDDDFQKWEASIVKHAVNPELHPEARSRLKRILDANLSDQRKAVRELIDEKSLLSEVGLVLKAWKAKNTKKEDPALSQKFAAHLRTLTSADVSDDIAEWQKWAVEHQAAKPESASSKPDSLVVEESNFDYFAVEVAKLCQLQINEDGRLGFDRQAWSAELNFKTPKQLAGELAEFSKAKKIPQSWILDESVAAGYDPQHLVFQKLGERTQKANSFAGSMGTVGLGSVSQKGQKFDSILLNGALTMKPGRRRFKGGRIFRGNPKPEPEFIRIMIRDNEPDGMRLELFENEKQFSVVLIAPAENAFLFMGESETGFVIHDLRGDSQFSATAKSYQEFLENHRAYIEESLLGTLKTFCVSMSKEAGGVQFDFESKPLSEIKKKK